MDTNIIALDIGRVCVNLRYDQANEALGYPKDTVHPEFFLRISHLFEHGLCTEERWMKIFQRMTGNRFDNTELKEAWNLIIGEPVDGMVATLHELTDMGYQFVYFSDTNPLHLEKFFRCFPAAGLAIGGIYSCDVGVHKPSPRMYDAFETQYGKPCYYMDDKAENIEGAKRHGWTAHQFTTTERFREAFPGLG